MRTALAFLATALLSAAGVVQGVVVEQISGLPLSRTIVRLEPVAGQSMKPSAARSGRGGQFTFLSVPEGLYLLRAQRTGYFPAAHGQRRPTGAATPIVVSKDSDFFTTLSMRRLGGISGRVLDENGVGMPGIPVVAYKAQRPLAVAGRATSDDRGVYRIPGLLPGKYWVRTGPATLDDGSGRLPTFAPESREPHDAKMYRVDLDADTPDGDVRPEAGNLVRVSGKVQCPQMAELVVLVTLASETGHRTMETVCNAPYAFEAVAPGPYEIFAAVRDLPQSGYVERTIDRDTEQAVRVDNNPVVQFELYKAGSSEAPRIPMTLYGRRRDLSETAVDRQLDVPRSVLAAGPWEMSATVGAGYFVEAIGSPYNARRPPRADPSLERFDVLVENRVQARIRITVSDQVGQIEGTVMDQKKSVPGIPVFLWPVDPNGRRALRGVPQASTTVDGKFRFENLPPGDYRLLATFDVSEVEEDIIDAGRAASVKVSPGQRLTPELTPWVAP